ncbi:MAG TPA: sensor histidine kinase [Pyrinomonadaceae bacterium]|nr:sensor histidine kinase [Pyrinomonadaceae bacterium]
MRLHGPFDAIASIVWAAVLVLIVGFYGCAAKPDGQTIQITKIPPEDQGGVLKLDQIAGRVNGARNDQQVVLYARSGGAWYVQPWADKPFTTINNDSTWNNETHLGTEYAALLVERDYVPVPVTINLPAAGNGGIAITVVDGRPPFWRTWWFRLSLGLLGLFALLALYRWRVHRLRTQLSLRFEERLAERTRIAQDLHDTLLQGLVSASMQLHVANDLLPDDAKAKPMVQRVMQLMVQVIEEGRDAVRGLRSTSGNADDLETAFSHAGQEFGNEHGKDCRVIVEGTPRQLHPIIRDEAYRIGREALANAFRHAHANKIEIELEYSTKQLRILVRDDGAGIDPEVLESGRDGHWGLAGMRERAESIGARLKVWSRTNAGTEVELLIPDDVAFISNSAKQKEKS